MTIDEAISYKRHLIKSRFLSNSEKEAEKLGIEALERLRTVREDWHNNQPVIDVIEEAVSKLPSETEEGEK